MTAIILTGNKPANLLKNNLKHSISQLQKHKKRTPGLAVILIGDDPASSIYVLNKRKACAEVGINSYSYNFPANIKEIELLNLITELNHNQEIDGILVQLPLPIHINSQKIIEHINPNKDIDGFHPYNIGKLTQQHPIFRPCTPYGIINLLKFYQLPLKGKHAVIIGASNIVGRPMALEFLLSGSTVTICHKATKKLDFHVKNAEILVVATGVYNLINIEWLKPHQIVIDVGIHRNFLGNIHGDIDFDLAQKKVGWITPVPGGVGPMTIASLLENTMLAYQLSLKINAN